MIANTQISKRNYSFIATVIKEGKEIAISETKGSKQLHKLKITKKSEIASKFNCISFSWKDTYFAAGTSSGDINILNLVNNGNVEVLQKHHFGEINSI